MRRALLPSLLGVLLLGVAVAALGLVARPSPERQGRVANPHKLAQPEKPTRESTCEMDVLAARIPANLRQSLSSEGHKALRLALASESFAYGLVGYAASEAPQRHELQVLAKEKKAHEAFTFLFEQEDRPAARLLGLCGLYYTGRAAFDEGVMILGASSQRVRFQDGCLVMAVPVSEIVDASGSASRQPDIARGEIPRLLMAKE